ncbi:cysteine-rich CWC family protein [Accumulibacter sp.]|uniref:cysteine-rich CWC family protein n=1 Tax=Accumulibacter sp. TaxID=2053492 RepID=UPI001A5D60C7|nr:cysteine-rich CWC family protein [Accumulibacter sp.]MBL8376048.1 cysteine-rich CWC family protein [Accumulibacter sp.]
MCTNCGASFVCGATAGLSSCWCMQMPPLTRVPEVAAGCFCPACLEQLLSAGTTAPAA